MIQTVKHRRTEQEHRASARTPSQRQDAPVERAGSTEQDAGSGLSLHTLLLPSLAAYINNPFYPLPDTAIPVARIDAALTSLVPDAGICTEIRQQWASILARYIQACHMATFEQGATVSVTAKKAIDKTLKAARKEHVTLLEKTLQGFNSEYRLGLRKTYANWLGTFDTIGVALATLSASLTAMLVIEMTPSRNRQNAPDTEPEPYSTPDTLDDADLPVIDEKRRYLFHNGYVQHRDGLYSVRMIQGKKTSRSKIIDARVDVITRRSVFLVPSRLEQDAKPVGTVQVTQFVNPQTDESQIVEIHRADTLNIRPDFLTQIQIVAPPHPKKRGDLIHAIELLGQIAPVERRYNATGLIREQGKTLFLHPGGGAFSASGVDASYQVQFNLQHKETLSRCRYGWQWISTEPERIADYLTLLEIRKIAPGSTGYGALLLGIHGFCPMSQLCDTGGVHAIIHGVTGSFKSATSRLPLQGYSGVYGRNETSTVNLAEGKTTLYALEQIEYFLAGMFHHLDDALKGRGVTEKDIKEFYKMLSLRGRHAAERQGRDAGTWNHGDGGFSESYYPRGSSVVTVEILPSAEHHSSDLARYIVVSLDGKNCVDETLLTRLQRQDAAAAMNRVTASFLQWLIPRMEPFLHTIQAREEQYRALDVHVRTPTTYAKVETGLDALLQYGVAIHAITEQDAASMLDIHRAELMQLALLQKALMGLDEHHKKANDAVDAFYTLLRQAFRDGKLYATDAAYRVVDEYQDGKKIASIHRPKPPAFLNDEQSLADTWGWKFNESQAVYEPVNGSIEAGVLKHEPGTPVSLHMYVRDFKETLYPKLNKIGQAQDIPLPGLNDMLDKLKKSGKLEMTNATNLHGRASKNARCFILNMEYEPEPDTEPEPPAPGTEPAPAPETIVDISIDD